MTFVYVIRAGRHFKIGYSAGDPRKRLKELQTGSALPLFLMGYILGTHADEAALHRRYAGKRAEGEWFSLGWGDVGAILDGELNAGDQQPAAQDGDMPAADDLAFEHLLVADLRRTWPPATRGRSLKAACESLLALPGAPYAARWGHLPAEDQQAAMRSATCKLRLAWGGGWLGTELASGYVREVIFGEPELPETGNVLVLDNSISQRELRAYIREWEREVRETSQRQEQEQADRYQKAMEAAR